MSEATSKIQRLLESRAGDLRAQGAEMIRSLEDPEVDQWLLSGVTISEVRVPDRTWDMPSGLVDFEHPGVPRPVLLEVLDRTPSDGPAAAAMLDRLRRVVVNGNNLTQVLDVSWLPQLPSVTELVVSGRHPVNWHAWGRPSSLVPAAGLDRLAELPALTWLVVIGLADLDLAALAALPNLRRLTVRWSSVAAGSCDLSASVLERLDLIDVPGLTHLAAAPATLRELHLTELADLAGVGDLSAATGLTNLSVVDCPGVAALPPLPARDGSALRRVRLNCPALTSIAPLGGRRLESLDLTGCAALTSLDGFPETLTGPRLSLCGCAQISDLSAVVAAGAALRCVDLRGLAGVSDVDAFDRLPDLGTLALAGTATNPRTVPATLLSSCTWAHTPDLDLLGRRHRVRP